MLGHRQAPGLTYPVILREDFHFGLESFLTKQQWPIAVAGIFGRHVISLKNNTPACILCPSKRLLMLLC